MIKKCNKPLHSVLEHRTDCKSTPYRAYPALVGLGQLVLSLGSMQNLERFLMQSTSQALKYDHALQPVPDTVLMKVWNI